MEKDNNPRVLLITPSLNPSDNISGISSVAQLLIREMKDYRYIPFIVGKKDTEKRGFRWFCRLINAFVRIWSIKHVEIAHFNLAFEPRALLRDIFLFVPLWLRRIPVLLHLHGGKYMNRPPGGWKPLIGFFLQKAPVVVVLSEMEKSFLQTHYPNINERKIAVIPNAIAVPEFYEEEKDFRSGLSLVFLGRIIREKGLGKIAEALKMVKDKGIAFTFYLCGAGPDKDWFMQTLSPDLLDSIKDMGIVFGEEKQSVLQAAHLFLLPSHGEGLPVTLLESMANFTVPLVSSVGSIPLVVHEDNGRLVSSAKEMANAICELDADRDLLHALAVRSRQTIEDDYSIAQFVARFKTVYRKTGRGWAD
ncbi:MAG: glycosyltransferase family 4 protein [Tannerellaceae bacterium]|jgi:glycosyltransferase involved in cell wall biosynthesis|nr:glycosyltransferase family 4 protein [Tannerellaceae bacterium]